MPGHRPSAPVRSDFDQAGLALPFQANQVSENVGDVILLVPIGRKSLPDSVRLESALKAHYIFSLF